VRYGALTGPVKNDISYHAVSGSAAPQYTQRQAFFNALMVAVGNRTKIERSSASQKGCTE
jgi:hypothetical protein